jgi:hypothetical protein
MRVGPAAELVDHGLAGDVVASVSMEMDVDIEPERRVGPRLPLEMYLNTYVAERRRRAVTLNISEHGLYLNTLPGRELPACTPVGLEFALPGTREVIWAAGLICFHDEDDYFVGQGIRFYAMARLHAQLLRHYCLEKRFGGVLPRDRLAAWL